MGQESLVDAIRVLLDVDAARLAPERMAKEEVAAARDRLLTTLLQHEYLTRDGLAAAVLRLDADA